jgi:N,N'-diacetylchitobiose transport system substrate-binding protein
LIRKRLIPLAALAVVVMAGCNAGSTTSPTQAPSGIQAATSQPSTPASTGTLTVWMMNGSLNDNTVVQLNTDFQMAHPGWKVNYQVQQWDGIVAKLTTALASNTPPDIVEMGNTQAITFEAAGALADITSSRQALGGGTSNDSASADQLFVASLNSASVYQNKLYAIPFYAGDRVLIYRKDLFTAAGIDPASITSKDKVIAAAQTLQQKNSTVQDFSGFYQAGQNWYSLLQMIWDRGGSLATQGADGKWTANLESAQSMQGIQDYVDYYKAGSTGPKDNDEMNPPEYTLFSQGKVGMFVGNGWEIGSAVDPKGVVKTADQVGVMAIPSATDGKTVPVFLGGSVIGIAAKSPSQAQALDYLKQLTSDSGQQLLIGNGWIPSLKAAAANIPATNAILKVQASEAAAGSGFTPNDPRWAGVEANNPIKSMLTKILTNQASIADAAKAADAAIDAIMNAAQ